MEKDFAELIEKRCERTLKESEEYKELQNKCVVAYKNGDIKAYSDLVAGLQAIVVLECYMRGAKDAVHDLYTGFVNSSL